MPPSSPLLDYLAQMPVPCTFCRNMPSAAAADDCSSILTLQPNSDQGLPNFGPKVLHPNIRHYFGANQTI